MAVQFSERVDGPDEVHRNAIARLELARYQSR
jgi:hypothetical protein